jgi:hypothetical protein
MLFPEFLHEDLISRHVPADGFSIIVVIGQRRIDLCQAQLRVYGADFVRRQSLPFMEDNDVLHVDAMPRNARFPPRRCRESSRCSFQDLCPYQGSSLSECVHALGSIEHFWSEKKAQHAPDAQTAGSCIQPDLSGSKYLPRSRDRPSFRRTPQYEP